MDPGELEDGAKEKEISLRVKVLHYRYGRWEDLVGKDRVAKHSRKYVPATRKSACLKGRGFPGA